MPIKTISETSRKYYLIAFDEKGKEREEGKTSKQILNILSSELITDVFIFIHGWMGDVPEAHKQYSKWVEAMAQNPDEIKQMQSSRAGFRPLLIGLHWPSLQWGDENLDSVSFDTTDISPVEQLIEEHAQFIADTEAARDALKTIFTAAMENSAPDELPPEVEEAYSVLRRESGLDTEGVGAAPGADLESFDAEEIFQAAEDEPVDFANPLSFIESKLLKPLEVLTFWKMKDRARRIGETAGFELLTKLQQATCDRVRFHLMGHSFGCIVVSAMLAGPNCRGTLVRPVNSVSLIQGALSLWSYCDNIPVASGRSGYFHRIIADRKVNGPIITTQSEKDSAVGRMYPQAAFLGRQISYDLGELPKYGAVGTYGICGLSPDIAVYMKMLPSDGTYKFEPGKIYNLESTQYICNMGDGFFNRYTTGAHNDIAIPQVANAVWQAALGS